MSYHFAGHYLQWPFNAQTQAFLDQEELSAKNKADEGGLVLVYEEDSAGAKAAWSSWLKNASELSGQAMFICVQANVGCFLYEHWQQGQLKRKLEYYSDAGWVSVEGDAEPWEATHFFSQERLQDLQADLERDLQFNSIDANEYAQRKAELNSRWRSKQLEAGADLPYCFEELAVHQLAGHFGVMLHPGM